MNEVLENAKALGLSIVSSEEMKAYQKAEQKLLERNLLTTYLTYEQAKLITLNEDISVHLHEDAEGIIHKHQKEMEQDPDVIAFRKAELGINSLVANVNETILHFCGIDPTKKGCASCNGCSGK